MSFERIIGGNVILELCSNSGNIITEGQGAGGIVGLLYSTGKVQYCYSSCDFQGGDIQGTIVGQFNNSNSAIVSNCYYTDNNSITGIGSKGTDNTVITTATDLDNEISTISYLSNYQEFKTFMLETFSDLTFD